MVQTTIGNTASVRTRTLQETRAGRNMDYPSTTPSTVPTTYVFDCPTDGQVYRTSQEQKVATDAQVFPNPARNQINIQLNGISNNVKVELTDLLGRVIETIYTGKSEGLNTLHQLPNLSAGLYLVNISIDGKYLPVQKLIIAQ
jgi:hypothetical protein